MEKITLRKIAEMSDEEVFTLSMPRPFHPEMRGFMFPPQKFGSIEEMAECVSVLMQRLSKIKKIEKV